MRDFVFENKTKVYFGKEQMCHLHEEVARFGKRVLMVYGGGSIKRIGLYDKVMAELQKAGAKAAILALETFFFEILGLKSRLSDLGIDDKNFAAMARKACGAEGILHGFTNLTPADVEKIFRMCL